MTLEGSTCGLCREGSSGTVVSSTFYANDGRLHNFEVEEEEAE